MKPRRATRIWNLDGTCESFVAVTPTADEKKRAWFLIEINRRYHTGLFPTQRLRAAQRFMDGEDEASVWAWLDLAHRGKLPPPKTKTPSAWMQRLRAKGKA